MNSAKRISFNVTLLVFIVNVYPVYGRNIFQLNMEVKKSNCTISGATLLNYYMIQCPVKDVKLQIVLGPGTTRTAIECFHLNYSEFEQILPNLTIGAIKIVEIKNCPLPEHKPISTIFQQLGLLNVSVLIFNTNYRLGKNLNKIHLSNLFTLRNLTLKLENITSIPNDLLSDSSLKTLDSLELYSSIRELPHNIFFNLENIEFMALKGNLYSLPTDIFHHQTRLTKLILSNNRLTNVTKQHFSCSSTLESLILENNLIEVLSPDIFSSLTNLTQLDLSANKLSTIPQRLLENNKKLREFILKHNQLPLMTMPSKFLANLPYLTDVNLQQCGLEQVPTNLFQNSNDIKWLDMSNNKLKELPEKLFGTQIYLKYLNLSNNTIQHLPDNLFQSTTHLKVINVSCNDLRTFKSEMFQSTKQIENIIFSNNKLTTPDIQIMWSFRYLQDLRKLDFSHNLISSISRDWTMPYLLETFNLSYNNLTELNDNELTIYIINNLELILTHNQITTITLHNQTLGKRDFQNQLLKVDLNNNPIKCDCKLLSFVEFFKDPNKNYNIRENVNFLVKNLTCKEPNIFNGVLVKNLEPADLLCKFKAKCPPKCICSIRSFDQLLIMDCSRRNLLNIPDIHPIHEYSLKGIELNMKNNRLLTLPDARTPGYANVTKLLIANNYLSHLQKHQLPVNLTYLDIRGNYLETLRTDTLMFINSNKLSQVYLSNNSWVCDCAAKPLLRFTQSNIQLFKDFSNMTCANTEHPTFFYDLHDLCPIERKFYIFLFILIAILCLLIALYYKYQNEIKIWLYAHNMCLWLVIEDELDQDKIYDAFISHSAKDEDFVLDILLPELENGRPAFRLCVHVRDWLVGECIPDQILRSIANSRKTIIVLSKNFIESVWAKMEFKAAHQAALKEGRAKVIVIIYEDIENVETLDEDLKAYLKMNTYLKWGDPWFWEKLRYALPHITRNRNSMYQLQEVRSCRR